MGIVHRQLAIAITEGHMSQVRLGVIGTGLIWRRTHQAILATLADTFVPIAFCDISDERRVALAHDYPDALVVGDYERLLALPDLDAVLILTPIASNAPVARAALLAGKHVIMEKPIARSVSEGRELIAIARRMGKHLFVTEQLAYRHLEEALVQIIATGEVGDVVGWERAQREDGDPARGPLSYASTQWRKEADFPLGTMFDGGIHLIATLSKVFGTPETVFATGRKLRPEYGAYDYIVSLFQYRDGVSGVLSYASALQGSHNFYYVFGTAGTLVVEQTGIIVEKPGQPDRRIDLAPQNAYVTMWHALAAAFSDQRVPGYTADNAVQDVAILEAIDQAIATGQRVTVVSTT
jgi:scyllo-inositol 2-dehydrogenase (NADP+)